MAWRERCCSLAEGEGQQPKARAGALATTLFLRVQSGPWPSLAARSLRALLEQQVGHEELRAAAEAEILGTGDHENAPAPQLELLSEYAEEVLAPLVHSLQPAFQRQRVVPPVDVPLVLQHQVLLEALQEELGGHRPTLEEVGGHPAVEVVL